jgi:hypothetical protein
MSDMDLARQMEQWKKFWDGVSDSADVERQLQKLRWLEEFAFHCGTAIRVEQYRALERQIEAGERKLAELTGCFLAAPSQTAQPDWMNR